MSREKYKAIYKDAILSCINNNVFGWWKVKEEDIKSKVSLLSFFKEYVLRRGGDYNSFISFISRNIELSDSESKSKSNLVAKRLLKFILNNVFNLIGNTIVILSYVYGTTRSVIKYVFKTLRLFYLKASNIFVSRLQKFKRFCFDNIAKCVLYNKNYFINSRRKANLIFKQLLRKVYFYNKCRKIFLGLLAIYEFKVNNKFIVCLIESFNKELQEIDTKISSDGVNKSFNIERNMLLAVLAWGDHYTDMLIDYCLPSLMAEGNIKYLTKNRNVCFLVHTNSVGKEKIANSNIIKEIENLGVKVIYSIINKEILSLTKGSNIYWFLGMIQTLQLEYARNLKADYHIVMPDLIYSNEYFKNTINLVNNGKQVILQTAFRTNFEDVKREIVPYTKGGIISVSAPNLISIGLKSIHSFSEQLIMNNYSISKIFPSSHILLWEGKDKLYVISPHQTIVYLDYNIIQKLPTRFYLTLDSELNKIIPEDAVLHCAKAEDNISYIEVTPKDIHVTNRYKNNIDNYAANFWSCIESPDYLRFFDEDIVFPINRNIISDREYCNDNKIKNEISHIRKTVHNNLPSCSIDELIYGIGILSSLKDSVNSRDKLIDNTYKLWLCGRHNINSNLNNKIVIEIVRQLCLIGAYDIALECLERKYKTTDVKEIVKKWEKYYNDNEEWIVCLINHSYEDNRVINNKKLA